MSIQSKQMIEVRDLVFEYPGFRALHEVNCTIEKGSIVALVGPNGAGKTTLMQCIAGLQMPFSGDVLFNGESIFNNTRAWRKKAAYLPDFFGLFQDLTVWHCLEYAARLNLVPENEVLNRMEEVLAQVDLVDKKNAKAGSLSRGMKQRLALAQSIIHKPEFLILDEPASGLDPEARHKLADLFKKLQKEGITLLVSSHILAELDQYASNMLVINKGQLVVGESLEEDERVVLEVFFNQHQDGIELPTDAFNLSKVLWFGQKAHFYLPANPQFHTQLLKHLFANGLDFYSAKVVEANLQDKYLRTIQSVK